MKTKQLIASFITLIAVTTFTSSCYFEKITSKDPENYMAVLLLLALNAPTGSVTFYLTSDMYNGNLGGRSGADSKCSNEMHPPCKQIHAVASFSDSDSILNMPSTLGFSAKNIIKPSIVPDTTATTLTTYGSWSDFVASGPPQIAVGVAAATNTSFWSFSYNNGSFAGETSSCSGGTSTAGDGQIANWLAWGTASSCGDNRNLLCACIN